jgi:sugar-specific transcriptional regulator TrmB
MNNEIHLDEISKHLGIKNNAKRVFELLLVSKPSPVSLIAKELHLPKSTIYDAISQLMDESLLIEYAEGTGKKYGIAPKEQIINLHQKKIDDLQLSQDFITEKLKEIEKNDSIIQPKIKFYSGKDGIKHAFNDMPWIKGVKESYLMWSMQEMIDSVGEEFLISHGKNRYLHNIKIKVVRKYTDRPVEETEWLKKDSKEKLTEARYAPKDVVWTMSYWIYDDKTLFATPGKEQFAFIIYSKEFADMMIELWKQMWNVSKP